MPERGNRSNGERWLRVGSVMKGALVLGLLAGCGSDAASVSPATPTNQSGVNAAATRSASPGPAAVSPRPVSPSPVGSPVANVLVGLVTEDAARRANVREGDVRIMEVEARDWPDRSLGCPKPGLGYAQAITPGYRIVAEAGGRQLEYHTDHAQVVLCEP